MSKILTHSLAGCASVFLALSLIGSIATTPQAQAMSPVAAIELA
ncbi:MAG: hypothetical protein SXU28_01575 [Pseudomonadota bacterium]|nr:hypothetical protein [Pseudomonadota bacterium]